MTESTKRAQKQKVFDAFNGEGKTMLQVSVETNILRGNICRYVAKLKRQNKIAIVKEDRCPISKHPAQFLTTNPDRVKKIHSQLELEVSA